MIERFNNVHVDENLVTFNDIIYEYDFEEVKDIYYAYQHSNMKVETREDINMALNEIEKQGKETKDIKVNDNNLLSEVPRH
jgi:hypothetical protein